MRIRITPENQKLVNKSRGKNLSANAEVNRVLADYYGKPSHSVVAVTNDQLKALLGDTNVRKLLRTE